MYYSEHVVNLWVFGHFLLNTTSFYEIICKRRSMRIKPAPDYNTLYFTFDWLLIIAGVTNQNVVSQGWEGITHRGNMPLQIQPFLPRI